MKEIVYLCEFSVLLLSIMFNRASFHSNWYENFNRKDTSYVAPTLQMEDGRHVWCLTRVTTQH